MMGDSMNEWEAITNKERDATIADIREIANNVIADRNQYREAFEKSQQEIEKLKDNNDHAEVEYGVLLKEIERRDKLLEIMVRGFWAFDVYKEGKSQDDYWQQFKTENNL